MKGPSEIREQSWRMQSERSKLVGKVAAALLQTASFHRWPVRR